MLIQQEHKKSLEQQRIEMAEKIWLLYFNETLFKQGLITERDRNLMRNKINARKSRMVPKTNSQDVTLG